jgi:hypothetical protein
MKRYGLKIAAVEVRLFNLQCVRKVAVHLYLRGAAKSAVYRNRPRMLNEIEKFPWFNL